MVHFNSVDTAERLTQTLRGYCSAGALPPCGRNDHHDQRTIFTNEQGARWLSNRAAYRTPGTPASDLDWVRRFADDRTTSYARSTRPIRRERGPSVFGDLISYRNGGKGCTRALIGSNEP
jgi:hypothetical protein